MRHLRNLKDLSIDEFHQVLEWSHRLKQDWRNGNRPPLLALRSIGLLFEKPSLRTRLSFEAGMTQLGGSSIYLSQDVGWQTRESPKDFVRVLAEYCDVLVCRTFSHATVEELASYNALPVINGLTDLAHPCQALADIMTMQEVTADLRGKVLVFVGDGNNVCRSLCTAAAMAGMSFRLLGAQPYFFAQDWVERLRSRYPEFVFDQTTAIESALSDADFIYTDVWTSMGQEAESEERNRALAPYQLNEKLVKLAPPKAKILHCLPARRGEEITDGVLDGPQSIVIQQAGNRMHLQKGLLVWLAQANGWISFA